VTAAPERSSPLPLLGWTVFVVLVLYAVLLGGGWLGIYSVGLRTLSLVLTAIGLGAWLVAAWRRPEWRPSTAIWPAVVLPPAALGLSALASPFQRLGLEYVAWTVLLTALYLLLARILALPYARARIGGLAAILGLVLGLAYIGWVLLLWVEWWGLVGRLQPPPLRPLYLGLTWGNPSAVLTVEVLLLLIAAAGLGSATRGARLTLAALSLVTLLVVVMSGSRAGWLALAGAAVLVGGLWLLRSMWLGRATRQEAIGRALADRRVRVGIVAGVAVLGILAVVFAPGILSRFQDGGDGGRLVYYSVALRMFADAPVLGLGPGTWAARRIAYTEPGELDFYIPHAHNVYLHTAAELGVVGLLVGAIILACVGWLILRAALGEDPARRRWAWAAGFGLVYLGLHSLFDYYSNMPAVLLLAAIPIATLDATADRRLGLPRSISGTQRPLRALALGALVVASIASMAYLARAEAVAFTHQAAVTAANQGDWAQALGPAISAAREDPLIAPYQLTLGLAAAGSRDWATAEAAFRRAADIDDLPAAWLGLALSQLEQDAPNEEVAHDLERALRLGIQQPAVAFAAAQLYDRIGMTAEADDAFVASLTGAPELAGERAWPLDAVTSARLEGILEGAMAAAPGVAWELALLVGDSERARELVADPVGSSFQSQVIDAWAGDGDAVASIQALADENVYNPWILAWAARVSEHAGDRQAAERYRRLVDLGIRGADQGVEVGIGERVAQRDAALGTRTYYYGNYMHRRTTPIDVIVPGIPGLIIREHPDGDATSS
jgi:O-antigen ligase